MLAGQQIYLDPAMGQLNVLVHLGNSPRFQKQNRTHWNLEDCFGMIWPLQLHQCQMSKWGCCGAVWALHPWPDKYYCARLFVRTGTQNPHSTHSNLGYCFSMISQLQVNHCQMSEWGCCGAGWELHPWPDKYCAHLFVKTGTQAIVIW